MTNRTAPATFALFAALTGGAYFASQPTQPSSDQPTREEVRTFLANSTQPSSISNGQGEKDHDDQEIMIVHDTIDHVRADRDHWRQNWDEHLPSSGTFFPEPYRSMMINNDEAFLDRWGTAEMTTDLASMEAQVMIGDLRKAYTPEKAEKLQQLYDQLWRDMDKMIRRWFADDELIDGDEEK